MYKYFTLLFFVLLSIQLVSKPQNKKNKIPQKLPIYVETHINSSDSILEKTAINMLLQKLDDSLIKSVTGFSQDDLNKLKNKI